MGKRYLKIWGYSAFLIALYIMVANGLAFGQVTQGTVFSKTEDGVGNKITSTVVGADRGIDTNCLNCAAAGTTDVNVIELLGVAPGAANPFPQRLSTGVAFYDARDRNWTLASGTDSVSAVQSGVWNIGALTSITNPVAVTGTFFQATQPVSQSGTWNIGTVTTVTTVAAVTAITNALPTGTNTIGNVTTLSTVSSANNDGTCPSGAASFTVLASNASRTWAVVWASPANTDDVFIKLAATATNADGRLAPGQAINFTSGRIYTGIIDALPASGTQAVCTMELN